MFIIYFVLFLVACFLPIPFQIILLIGDMAVTGPGFSTLVLAGSIIARRAVKKGDI